MNILIYFAIFISKVIENALGTLRLILVANGKKGLGALLQFLVALVWLYSAGAVLIDVQKDPLKIFVFAFGSFVGSYVGSYIEEKMAMGNNTLISIVDKELGDKITNTLREKGFAVTVLSGEGKDKSRNILMIVVPRKKRHYVINIIKRIDKDSMIVSENTQAIIGGYHNSHKR
ncbi:MAG: DUF2179 domain-containing protein [Mollicutes bacterium]|nr:DUF2179 domain-containing protein [Mollicutes bacterium]